MQDHDGMDSYQLIGTFAPGSGDLYDWTGAASAASGTAPGNLGTPVDISAFNVGATFADVPYEVLNTGYFGTDELDLTSLLSTMSPGDTYTDSDAPTFDWGGSSSSPGPGDNNETIGLNTGPPSGIVVINADLDTSAWGWVPSQWGFVQNYELYLNAADAGPGVAAQISDYQDVDVKIDSDGWFGAYGVQRGVFDFTGNATAEQDLLGISPVSPVSATSESTFVVKAGAPGMTMDVGYLGNDNIATESDAGATLLNDGSTSLVDFYDDYGSNTINLTDNVSSNLYLGMGRATMAFLSASEGSYGIDLNQAIPTSASNGDDVVNLNASGSGVATIYLNDETGLSVINGFELGRDTIDMAMTNPNSYDASALNYGSTAVGASFISANGGYGDTGSGFVVGGITLTTLGSHQSFYTSGGVTHLVIH